MICFCRHEWETLHETYAKPRPEMDLDGAGPDLIHTLEVAAFGQTTLHQRCRLCRRTREVEMLGRTVKP